MEPVEISKIYIRSIIAIVVIGIMVCFGLYLGQVTETVWTWAIGGVVACVAIDKIIKDVPIA